MVITRSRQEERKEMVERQLKARGIKNPAVLRAMGEVPREAFMPEAEREFAYSDVALDIGEGEMILQPYIVALIADGLDAGPGDRALVVGAGSGYLAAVLSRIAAEVYAVEPNAILAREGQQRLDTLGYENAHIRQGVAQAGWPEYAPYDAIAIRHSSENVPADLRRQLRSGGRLVSLLGDYRQGLRLVRLIKQGQDQYRVQDLSTPEFVPRAAESEASSGAGNDHQNATVLSRPETVAQAVARAAEPIAGIEEVNLDGLMARINECRVVLIGEASHGTSEFYRMRAHITKELIQQHGFTIIGCEADWPDMALVDRYARQTSDGRPQAGAIFSRFPAWMWKNLEVLEFVEWLRAYNRQREPDNRVGIFGLDLYSLYSSIGEVLHYLDKVDPESAQLARIRYGCLTPFESDPAKYGLAALTGRYQNCETDVVKMLSDLLAKRVQYLQEAGRPQYFNAEQNARVVADAEKYYRAMYYGSAESWNLRDQHMFDTLLSLLQHFGPNARAVVWAHNSHVGNAAYTEMSARGEYNIGELTRSRFGDNAYVVGFGTDHGTVAAAHDWGDEVEIMRVRPSNERSYERICHDTGIEAFLLPLRKEARPEVRAELEPSRLERAIGVIYRPDTELLSHYFQAILPAQFDEYIWFDETHAVTPLGPAHAPRLPDAHPFAIEDE